MFRCTNVEGEWYLTSDMQLKCFDAQWSGYATLSIVMLAVYTVGLPLGIVIVLRRNRKKLHQPKVRDNLGFLYVAGQRSWWCVDVCV